jgi:hypothetical protein
VAAEDREAGDHVVAGCEIVNFLAYFLDDAGRLVAKDGRRGKHPQAFDEVEVGMTYTAGHGADQDLALAGLVDVYVFDDERLVRAAEDCCFHWGPPGSVDYRAGRGRLQSV